MWEKFGEIYNIRDETIGEMNKIAVTFATITTEMEESLLEHMKTNVEYPNEFQGREEPFAKQTCVTGVDDSYVNHLDDMHVQSGNGVLDQHAVAKPPEVDSPENIIHALNDDVLMEIFAKFDEIGLYNLANVCSRFREIAGKCFASKYKELKYFNYKRYESLSGMVKLIRTFGPHVKAIHLDLNYGSARVVPIMIAIHCTTLEKLHLNAPQNAAVQKSVQKAMDQILPRLKILTIKQYLINMRSLIDSACQLETLKISDIDRSDRELVKLDITMPNLKELCLFGCDTASKKSLLMSNRKLQIFRLHDVDATDISILQLLPSHLEKLQELDISFRWKTEVPTLPCWRKFKYLKRLAIAGNPSFPVNLILLVFLESNIQLESIKLDSYNTNKKTVELLCRMETLTELTLHECNKHFRVLKNEEFSKRPLFEHLKLVRFKFSDITVDWIISCLVETTRVSKIFISIEVTRNLKMTALDVDEITRILVTRPGVRLHLSMKEVS